VSGILVVLETRNQLLTLLSVETLAAAAELAAINGLPVYGVLLGDDAQTVAQKISASGIAKIYAVEHALLASYTVDAFTLALDQLVRVVQSAFILFPHSYQVRDYAPRLAAQFGQSLLSDVIAIRNVDGTPIFSRQIFQGKLTADFKALGSPAFVSIQTGAFRVKEFAPSTAEIEAFTPQLVAEQIRTKPSAPFRESASTVDLGAAEKIVSIGRGIGGPENISLAEDLARALGAEIAGSGPVCNAGWLPTERQVGSSGHTVAPKLYIAAGISGAIQHLIGMKGSKTIVAINKDEHAPIFDVADYGIVGDLNKVLPALTQAVKTAKG
jgi:electron transfer flavoprotein alpha subunit